MSKLQQLMPDLVFQQLRRSSYFAPKSDSLVIQSGDSRNQRDNENTCWVKLIEEIRTLGQSVLRKETSAPQKAKVKEL